MKSSSDLVRATPHARWPRFIQAVLLVALMVPAMGRADEDDWARQEFPADHFAIQLPYAMALSKAEIGGPNGQKLKENLYRAAANGTTFEVAVIDLPGSSNDAALDWGFNMLIGAGKVRATATERIDRVFGRVLTVDLPDGGRSMAAVYFLNDKLYLLQSRASAAGAANMSNQALQFRESLEFIGYGFEASRPENRAANDAQNDVQGGRPPRGQAARREPPPQAYADCKDKAAGDSVQHTTPLGVVAAHCVMSPQGLVARPDRPLPAGP